MLNKIIENQTSVDPIKICLETEHYISILIKSFDFPGHWYWYIWIRINKAVITEWTSL